MHVAYIVIVGMMVNTTDINVYVKPMPFEIKIMLIITIGVLLIQIIFD